MQHYRFAMRNDDSESEYLGAMALADDNEALAFGRQLSQDLIERANEPPTFVVEIVEGGRAVASIPPDGSKCAG